MPFVEGRVLKHPLALLLFLPILIFGLVSCGNYSSPASSPAVTPGTASTTLISIGDAPADNIISFEITLNSVTLSDSTGANLTVLNNPFRIELTHLSGTFVPVAAFEVPQGTYTKLTATFSNPEIVILNANGSTSKREPPISNGTATINFSRGLVIGAGATSINLDFNVAQSVTFDASGDPTVSPAITATTGLAVPEMHRDENVRIEDTNGTVATLGTDSFTVATPNSAQPLAFKVGVITTFKHIDNFALLKAGMQVEVDAALQPDGSLLATRVEVAGEEDEDENEIRNLAEIEGLVIDIAGNPPTQISLITHYASAVGSMPSPGSTVDIAVDSNTKFAINDAVSLTGLPFTPVFNLNSLIRGQNVEVDALSATPPIAARKITLHVQSITGTVSNLQTGSITSFTLTVPADSAFARLSGMQNITIFQISGTELHDVSVANNASLRVRGLLFVDNGTLKMVAQKISRP
jgi:hypothetical protein